jgi:hypothetical protein
MRVATLCLLLLSSLPALAQPAPPPTDWKAWSPLIGDWVADSGGAGSPTGSCSFAIDLQGRVLVRKNVADYPKSVERPASHHEDTMIIYPETGATRADYWDNEGHAIHYTVTVEKQGFVFVSQAAQGQPRFRLTYSVTSPSALSLRFELAAPNAPEQWKPYIQATLHRKR